MRPKLNGFQLVVYSTVSLVLGPLPLHKAGAQQVPCSSRDWRPGGGVWVKDFTPKGRADKADSILTQALEDALVEHTVRVLERRTWYETRDNFKDELGRLPDSVAIRCAALAGADRVVQGTVTTANENGMAVLVLRVTERSINSEILGVRTSIVDQRLLNPLRAGDLVAFLRTNVVARMFAARGAAVLSIEFPAPIMRLWEGAEEHLSFTLRDGDGRVIVQEPEWSTTDSSVAYVRRGLIVANRRGRAVIAAKLGEKEEKFRVEVERRPPTPEQALQKSFLPGTGQIFTGRRDLGLALLAATGYVWWWGVQRQPVTHLESYQGPFGTPYQHDYESFERKNLMWAASIHIGLTVVAAYEAYLFADHRVRTRGGVANATRKPSVQLFLAGSQRSSQLGLTIQLPN